MKNFIIILINITFLIATTDSSTVKTVESIVIKEEIKFFGDHTIETGTLSEENIRVLGGDLYVNGTVDGKITVIGGDVTLGSSAIVNGTIVAIGGSINKDDGAVVHGKIIETHLKKGLVYREIESADSINSETGLTLEERSSYSTNSWIHPNKNTFVYNRNEGLIFNLNKKWDGAKKSSFRISTSLGYRFGPDDITGRLTLEKWFGAKNTFVLFASTYNESRSEDFYRLPEAENTWANFLARQDFLDRWNEEGWSAGVGFKIDFIKLKLITASAKQDTIPVQSDLWSLFKNKRSLRNNLFPVPQEQLDYLQATVEFQTNDYSPLSTGTTIFLQGEAYQPATEKESIYGFKSTELKQRIFGLLKWNLGMSYGIVLRTQFMAGSSKGKLHDFRKFTVGGLGSVSAFTYKYQTGDQMLQMNGELVFTEDFTDSWYFFKLFVDSGYAWEGTSFDFNQQNFVDYGISSAGVGIGSYDEDGFNCSLNASQPLDGSDYVETTIRCNYIF